jgi:hypothetical protein
MTVSNFTVYDSPLHCRVEANLMIFSENDKEKELDKE